MEEIKSAIDIVESHVEKIRNEKIGFDDDVNITQGDQRNSPAEEMRRGIGSMVALCKNISKSLETDTENITAMAKEFELWDQSAVAEE